MKNIYNIVPNNNGNHITISYRIHKYENQHQIDTHGKNLVVSGPQWMGNDILSRYHHAPKLHGYTGKCHLISHHISSYLWIHNLVRKGQKHPSIRPKTYVCTQTGPKGLYLICIICISIFICISYLYLYNHHTACICPQKAKAPKHTAQSLYVCSDGPQMPLISSVSLYLEGRVLSNDFKNNLYTYIHIHSNHTFIFIITSKSTLLIFKILSYFIQCRYDKPLTKHFNIISMRI